MPIREFRCEKCGHLFEELIMKPSEVAQLECPVCSSRRLCAKLSLFGVAGTEKKVSSGSCGSCSAHSCSTCKS